MRKYLFVVGAVALILGACSSDDDGDGVADPGESSGVEVPADATFCSVFDGEYADAIGNAVPATDDGFQDAADEITEWAVVLRDLAPAEIADDAEGNVSYHQAQADQVSASDFIDANLAFFAYGSSNCEDGQAVESASS